MEERYEIHIKYGVENAENEYDGIIDKKNNNEYICNWHSIVRLLNQYDERLNLQEQKIKKLEELLMLRKLEAKINDKYKYEEL